MALLCACAAAGAQDKAGLPTVTITASAPRDPVEKSYRKMINGMDLFERRHGLAPDASLRFRLLPRRRDTDMGSIRVDVIGKLTEFVVPVAADQTFSLRRDRQAYEEDAVVSPNRKAQTMTWRTEIRTPGLPAPTRRLGDLRLECEVGMEAGLVSNNRNLLDRILGSFSRPPDYCSRRDARYLFFSERPLFGVTLVSGERREIQPVEKLYGGASDDPAMAQELAYCDCEVLLPRTYFLPLGDRSWPDDTLVEFEFMDDDVDLAAPTALLARDDAIALQRVQSAIVAGRSTRADVASLLGKPRIVGFDNGYEVWVYREKPQRKAGPQSELVVLFSPTGVAKKTRVLQWTPPAEG